MFCKASLVTVALTLVASATPIARETGIRIPLSKRSSLTRPDGSFDRDAAIRQKVKVQNKHRQNLINFDCKVGLENSSNEGAHIPPLATVPASIQARQFEALKDQQGNLEWTGTISIGTPAQQFTIDFDTGSSDLCVVSSLCNGCESSATYSPASSLTSQKQGVTVAGVQVTNQYLSAVDSESGDLVGDVANGLLGMAFPIISELDANPFFQTAVQQGAVPEGVFGFKLAGIGSELYFGGTDPSLCSGLIEYHGLTSADGFWQIGGASAIVNGQTVVSNIGTVIDTGTTLMYGPASAVQDFYAAIEGAQQYLLNGLWSYPCDTDLSIGFTWGGKTWSISSDTFNQGTVLGDQCAGALGSADLGLGNNIWLLGDTFLMNVYAAFSTDNNVVGFAELS